MSDDDHKMPTRLVHAGRSAKRFNGTVNPPIQKGSTILAASIDDLYGGTKSLYGRMGLSAQDCLKDGLCELEQARFAHLAVNGLNACALALASFVEAGDHLIVSDAVYGPTRRFCEKYLSRMGVDVSFIPPRTGSEISRFATDNTKAVFLELPGSLTFELGDPEPILDFCRDRKLISIVDNTWGAGVVFQPLKTGFDVVVQALTKYVVGHSDAFGGAVMTNDPKLSNRIETTAIEWGISLSAEDAYLAQRGLRSIALRMNAQGTSALEIASFLKEHPAVASVHFPALPEDVDHATWRKYYSGPTGLFSFSLQPSDDDTTRRFFERLQLFSFGFSWGGFESLIIPCKPQLKRSQSPEWLSDETGELVRISVGLEDSSDLIADLKNALAVFL